MDIRYEYEIRPDVNSLPEDELYVIRTCPTVDQSLYITAGQYRGLRDCIISNLNTIYTRTKYKDADILDPYLSVRGYVKNHICLHLFHMKEWLEIKQSGCFDVEIDKRLSWGRYNMDRVLPSRF
jgi:hypothetical protein